MNSYLIAINHLKNKNENSYEFVKRLYNKKRYESPNDDYLKSIFTYIILGIAFSLAFLNRQYSVLKFESIIHEFDPW